MVRTLAAIRSGGMGLGAVAVMALLIGAALLGPNEAAAGGGCRGEASTSAPGTRVAMRETCFVPTVLHARVGDTVTWENESDAPHSVAGATLEWGDYEEISRGQTFTSSFAKAGVYPYYCFVHNGMIGTIVVEAPSGARVADTRPAAPPAAVEAASAVKAIDPPAAGTGAQAGRPPGPRPWLLGGIALAGVSLAAAVMLGRRPR